MQDLAQKRPVRSWLPLLWWFASFCVEPYIAKKRHRHRFGLVGKLTVFAWFFFKAGKPGLEP